MFAIRLSGTQSSPPQLAGAFFLPKEPTSASFIQLRNHLRLDDEDSLCVVLVDRDGLRFTLIIDGEWIATARALEQALNYEDLDMELPAAALMAVGWEWPEDWLALEGKVEMTVEVDADGVDYLSFDSLQDHGPREGTSCLPTP